MKSFLQNNDKEVYSMYNEEKSVIAEIFIRNLKKKFNDFNVKKCAF